MNCLLQCPTNGTVHPALAVTGVHIPHPFREPRRRSRQGAALPALYGPTQEAILVTGTILQLGDEEVSLAIEEMIDVDPIETHTCRITLYQDWGSVQLE